MTHHRQFVSLHVRKMPDGTFAYGQLQPALDRECSLLFNYGAQ